MFLPRKPRASLRASRRVTSQLTKLLKSTAKLSNTAAREGGKSVRRARKVASALNDKQTHRSPGRFVEVDGLRVHYIVRGSGRPVILIHGNGTMAEDFIISGLVDELAKRYRVIAIDRPGFGRTERPRHRVWTASVQAQLIHHVLELLNVERPVIVAHSWGTLVALSLATARLRELRGLLLLSGYYYPSRQANVALIASMATPGFGDAARSMMPAALGHLLAPQVFRHVFKPQPVPSRFKARFPVEVSIHPTQLRASAEDTASMNAAAALLQPHYSRLPVPLVIMTGDADAVVDAGEQSRRLHEEVAGSGFTMLAGQGHMIHYVAKAQIGRAVDGLILTSRTSLKTQ